MVRGKGPFRKLLPKCVV